MNKFEKVMQEKGQKQNSLVRGQVPTLFDFFSTPLSFFDSFENTKAGDNFAVDIIDKGDRYQLKADLPGVRKEDIKVSFSDGVLTIKASHHAHKEEKDAKGFLVNERIEGTYERSFSFEDADAENINAAFVKGELDISIGKKQKANEKCISIN